MARFARWLAGIVILAAVIGFILHAAELRNFAALLRHARPMLLLAVLLLQLSTYLWVALGWRAVLKSAGTSRSLRQLFPLSIAKLFADQAVPSAGISGNVLLVEQLTATGVPRVHAVTAMALSIVGYYASYSVLAIAVLVLLWVHQKATILLAASISIFLFVALGILGMTFLVISRGGRIPPALRRFSLPARVADLLKEVPSSLLRDRALLGRIASFNALVFIADAATLWVALAAVGFPAAFSTAFIAFILAAIAVTLGPIPMGLGSFEGVCIGMLRVLGVPVEAGAAATLIFRGFTLWLPLLPGLVLARRMVAHRSPREAP